MMTNYPTLPAEILVFFGGCMLFQVWILYLLNEKAKAESDATPAAIKAALIKYPSIADFIKTKDSPVSHIELWGEMSRIQAEIDDAQSLHLQKQVLL